MGHIEPLMHFHFIHYFINVFITHQAATLYHANNEGFWFSKHGNSSFFPKILLKIKSLGVQNMMCTYHFSIFQVSRPAGVADPGSW